MALVTVHPDHVARTASHAVQTAIIVGREPQATIDAFARSSGKNIGRLPVGTEIGNDVWLVGENTTHHDEEAQKSGKILREILHR